LAKVARQYKKRNDSINNAKDFIHATFHLSDSLDDEWVTEITCRFLLDSKSITQDCDAICNCKIYSIVNPNKDWSEPHPTFGPHRYKPQVWYHTLEQAYNLWKLEYFDYVIDVRTYEDLDNLPGWKTSHIPGSYLTPLNGCLDGSKTDCFSLDDFLSSTVCLDARIYVHCWVGVAANNAVEKLVELGFTNLHATGPEGSAGFLAWKANGWETVEDDTYDNVKPPKCPEKCSK